MDKYIDWLKKLENDLIEQFRRQPKIAVFQKAVARQLTEMYAFFYQLSVLQWLDQAQGVQLDGIGNIVDLSRTDALIWANMAGQNVPMNDDLYRIYLWFKIFLNTSDGTYADVARTLRMFWPDMHLYYSEYLEHPATMFFSTPIIQAEKGIDLKMLNIVQRVKAAGVSLIVRQNLKFDVAETPIITAAIIRAGILHRTKPIRIPLLRTHELSLGIVHAGIIRTGVKHNSLPNKRVIPRIEVNTATVGIIRTGVSHKSKPKERI